MAITQTYTATIQLTDGNWNGTPDLTPDPTNVHLFETATFDLASAGTATLNLSIIGDFNDNDEVLRISYNGDTAELFDTDASNDEWFTGQSTGPTNGTDNPLLGAEQPAQGNITINGMTTLTEASIDDIIANTAVFTSDATVDVSGDIGAVNAGLISFDFGISDFLQPDDGVDFAELQVELSVSIGDCDFDKAISNVVFYLQCKDGVQKIKIDEWSDLATEYKSTDAFDFSDNAVDGLAEKLGITEDCELIGLTIKAGNNREDGFRPNEANGEGEIIFGDIAGDYGKLNTSTISVDAVDYLDCLILV